MPQETDLSSSNQPQYPLKNPSPKTVAFHTFGCRLNQSETAVIAKGFQHQGYEVVGEKSPADVYVVNTCTVTHQSDVKNRQWIRSLHRRSPESQIVVIGCYAQMEPHEISNLPGVKLVIGNQDKLDVGSLLAEAQKNEGSVIIENKIQKTPFHMPFFLGELQTTRASVKIQDGCDFMCSFCIIPFSRGRSRCRDFQNIVEECQQLAASGTQEIVLTGVNLGVYQQNNYSLVSIVDALNEIPLLRRIRISSIEPTTVSPHLLTRMADPHHKLVPFLHLPLQAGSDAVLTQMKRRYSREAYREEVLGAYQQVPDLCLGADVMVGFPGETEEDFADTYDLLLQLPFAYFHVFPFSERKGTPAVKMSDKVTAEEKQHRAERVRGLSIQKQKEFQQQFIGTRREILFEGSKVSGWAVGYTDNYVRVGIPHENPAEMKNKIYSVELTHSHGDWMEGTLS